MENQNVLSDPTVNLALGFLLGLVGNFIASIIYDKFKAGQTQRASIMRRRDEVWQKHLSSKDAAIRANAAHEISINALRWFILGNVMFAISGMTWAIEFAGLYPFSNLLASATSVSAVIMFGVALSWIRLYLKSSPTISKEVGFESSPAQQALAPDARDVSPPSRDSAAGRG